jgi:hypothetical protein
MGTTQAQGAVTREASAAKKAESAVKREANATKKAERAVKREANATKIEEQLRSWSTQLEDLVSGYLAAGAQQHDPYRKRIDALRARHGVVQAKFDTFRDAVGNGALATFRADIAEDWAALESGFEDLTR